jgi:hypothetical protein
MTLPAELEKPGHPGRKPGHPRKSWPTGASTLHTKTKTPTEFPAELPFCQVVTRQDLLKEWPVGREIAHNSLDLESWPGFAHEEAPAPSAPGEVLVRRLLPGYRLFP